MTICRFALFDVKIVDHPSSRRLWFEHVSCASDRSIDHLNNGSHATVERDLVQSYRCFWSWWQIKNTLFRKLSLDDLPLNWVPFRTKTKRWNFYFSTPDWAILFRRSFKVSYAWSMNKRIDRSIPVIIQKKFKKRRTIANSSRLNTSLDWVLLQRPVNFARTHIENSKFSVRNSLSLAGTVLSAFFSSIPFHHFWAQGGKKKKRIFGELQSDYHMSLFGEKKKELFFLVTSCSSSTAQFRHLIRLENWIRNRQWRGRSNSFRGLCSLEEFQSLTTMSCLSLEKIKSICGRRFLRPSSSFLFSIR